MGFIRGAAKAIKVAKAVNDVRKSGGGADAVAGAAGRGAREVIKKALPLGTGKIVDKVAGDKIERFATQKAKQGIDKGTQAVQGRMGHFNSASGASSNNSSWDAWDTPSSNSTSTSTPAAAPKSDPWAW